MGGLRPRDPVDIAGPRPLAGVGARPLNFTVRGRASWQHPCVPTKAFLLGAGRAPRREWLRMRLRNIRSLVADSLAKVATDQSGWTSLYRDPSDNRLWELTYPHGEMHGGGPPTLRRITAEYALRKYPGLDL